MAEGDVDRAVTLAEATSPFGSLVAVLEDDGRTVYLYVHHAEQREWGMKALWVANRGPAPTVVDDEARAAKIAPRATRGATRHPDGFAPLEEGAVELVWTDAGDG